MHCVFVNTYKTTNQDNCPLCNFSLRKVKKNIRCTNDKCKKFIISFNEDLNTISNIFIGCGKYTILFFNDLVMKRTLDGNCIYYSIYDLNISFPIDLESLISKIETIDLFT